MDLTNQISTYSILLPFAVVLVRFYKINPVFYPFLLFVLFGLINETVSTWLIYKGGTNAPSFNLYSLIEALLVIWQFHKWKLFKSEKVLLVIMAVFLITWITEVLFVSGLDKFCSYFTLLTSFVITLLSISMINRLIIHERKNFLKNPAFVISVGFVFYFAYSLLVECFMINSNGTDVLFQVRIQQIFSVTNLFTNLLYTLAIIWMPTRLRFTLPY